SCTVTRHGLFIETYDLTGCGVNLRDSTIFFRIGSGAAYALPAFRLAAVVRSATPASSRTVTRGLSSGLTPLTVRLRAGRDSASHIEAIINVRNVEGVLSGMICHRPIALRVVSADDVLFSGFLQHEIPIDGGLSGFYIDVRDQEIRFGIRKRIRP